MLQATSAPGRGPSPLRTNPVLPEKSGSGNRDLPSQTRPNGECLPLWKPSPKRSASGHLTRAFLPLDPDTEPACPVTPQPFAGWNPSTLRGLNADQGLAPIPAPGRSRPPPPRAKAGLCKPGLLYLPFRHPDTRCLHPSCLTFQVQWPASGHHLNCKRSTQETQPPGGAPAYGFQLSE